MILRRRQSLHFYPYFACMISILIPVYNFAVMTLVEDLQSQVKKLGIDHEIRCYDDGSLPELKSKHHRLSTYDHIVYKELPENLGRAAIRNKLASEACYENLIFMDCDSALVGSDFLKLYMEQLGADVVCGGRSYADSLEAPSTVLHWKYGRQRECRSLAERQAEPQRYFHSNNFMIRKSTILTTPFDESISGYGYEDLLLGKQLQEKGIEVVHIDNPVQHLGLEVNQVFLDKTRTAVLNLKELNKAGLNLKSRLEVVGKRLQALKMAGVYKRFYEWRKSAIERNLVSDDPKLIYLDYYKLYVYMS